jgi:hypothetical protein
MNCRNRGITLFLALAAFTLPTTLRASSTSHLSQRNEGSQGRIYDQKNRDWHDWNDNEERAYRQFLTENRREYREFTRLDAREQSEYWNWRHAHPDRDDRDQHDRNVPSGKRYYDQNTGQWHDWNDNEDRAYRRFLDENHHPYIVFDQADLGLQLQFWLWRKFHPDGVEQGRQQGPQRYFDPNHNEWHDWNEREEAAYRGYLVGNNRAYVEFSTLSLDNQVLFWTWRRAHPDPDARGFKRYFDQGHNDWHVWDENEDRAYRTFMNGRHWPYREITELLPRDQQRYWDWRHQHPDKDPDHR